MANRTVKDARTVKGTNPQYLVEKIIRTRIYESKYWKEECFALSAELLVDKAMELKYVGGVYGGNVKPAPFLCLILKMLQIQPEKDIIVEFISQPDFKYVRALGALYMRLVGTSLDCYKYLEPLYLDYRKLKMLNKLGGFELVYMDDFIDELLHEERCCDVILPRIQKRHLLEDSNQLDARRSALDDDLEEMEEDEEEGEFKDMNSTLPSAAPANDSRGGAVRDWDRPRRSPSPRFRRSRSPPAHRRRADSKERDVRRDRDRERDREREREKERERERDKHRRRSRSRSPHDRDRRHKREEGLRHHRAVRKGHRDMDNPS